MQKNVGVINVGVIGVWWLLLGLCLPFGVGAEMTDAVRDIQQRWAVIKYQMPKKEQVAAFEKLAAQAKQVAAAQAGQAEPLAWEGIVLATWAGAKGGLGALSLAKQARDRLLAAEKIDSQALSGSIYTSLGSLFYQVPGWPVGFGDKDKARDYLQKALTMNPDGIDPNYFYGDFLREQGDLPAAVTYLEKALKAAPRPGREVADEGRKAEIRIALGKAKK